MSNINEMLDAAFSAYNSGQFDEAEAYTRQALNLEPTNCDGLYLLGLIAFQSGSLENSSKILYQIVKLYPDNINYVCALASVLHRQGHLDEALSFYEKHKDNPTVLAQIGFIYLGKGQEDWAKSAFEQSLSQDATRGEASIGLADIYCRHGDFAHAEKVLSDAQKHVSDPDISYRLAKIYRETRRFDEALTQIDNALQGKKNALYFNEKGLILEGLQDDDGALEMYQLSVETDAYDADGLANQANIYARRHQFDVAEDLYKRALTLDPKFFMAHHNLASLLYRQSRYIEALNHYQEAIILEPHNLQAIYNLGIVQEDLGEYTEAAGLYFNVLTQGLAEKALPFRIATVLQHLYQTTKEGKKQALDFVKGWIKNFPNDVVAHHTHDIFTGKKTTNMLQYSEQLFDVFAVEYNQKMQNMNSLTIDKTIELIGNNQYEKVLDIACGTGLFAKKFKQNFKTIYGVDISEEMLKQADLTGIYHQLFHDSFGHYFQTTKQKFDLIVALDLSIYLDCLSDLFKDIRSHLTKNGKFVFSVEIPLTSADQSLSGQGHYLHSLEYVMSELSRYELTTCLTQPVILRRDLGEDIKGYIIIAQ